MVALTSRGTSTFSPMEEKAEGDHISEYKYLEEGCRGQSQTFFNGAQCQDQRQLAPTKKQLNIRTLCFIVTNCAFAQLFRELMESPFFDILKNHLDMVWLQIVLLIQGT